MKRLLIVLALVLLATPSFAANYYLTGFSGAGTTEDPRCVTIVKTIDASCSVAWTESYTYDVVANDGVFAWALVRLNWAEYGDFNGLSGVYLLPVFPFDVEMNAMTNAKKNEMTDELSSRSIPTTCVSQAAAYRDVIRCIGQQIQPEFSEIPWGN